MPCFLPQMIAFNYCFVFLKHDFEAKKIQMFRMLETHFNMSTSLHLHRALWKHSECVNDFHLAILLPMTVRKNSLYVFFSCLMLNRIYGFAFYRKDSIDSFLFATTVFCWIHYKVYIYINIMLHHGFLLIAKTGGAVGS